MDMDVQDVEFSRRSGHIPAFGNWDYANDLPITQYFDSARQAGLIRFCHHPDTTTTHTVDVSSLKKRRSQVAGRRTRNTRNSNLTTTAAAAQVKEENKVVKSQQQQQQQKQKKHMYAAAAAAASEKKKIINRKISNSFKPESEPVVDEDLYKIPPHLLRTSKRKKMLGFLSRCLGPGCTL